MRTSLFLLGISAVVNAACPYMDGAPDLKERSEDSEAGIHTRDLESDEQFLNEFTINDSDAFISTDAGGPIQDSTSLKAGERGPTLLEDFIFRQKIQHFDHERVSDSSMAVSSLINNL
jgi:catalase